MKDIIEIDENSKKLNNEEFLNREIRIFSDFLFELNLIKSNNDSDKIKKNIKNFENYGNINNINSETLSILIIDMSVKNKNFIDNLFKIIEEENPNSYFLNLLKIISNIFKDTNYLINYNFCLKKIEDKDALDILEFFEFHHDYSEDKLEKIKAKIIEFNNLSERQLLLNNIDIKNKNSKKRKI